MTVAAARGLVGVLGRRWRSSSGWARVVEGDGGAAGAGRGSGRFALAFAVQPERFRQGRRESRQAGGGRDFFSCRDAEKRREGDEVGG
ncbi:unnamed protein product [Linum trigynum]|uniref:Uncharacterized protein n=1 Tax=Linum trigynum TaxID=586398 RepID=A0AAV2CD37_9ROSI